MDGQSRLTINLLMWPPRGLKCCHVGYVMWGLHIKKNNSLWGWAVVVLGGGVRLFGSDEEREGIVFLLYVGPT